jgi:hypothetical protein
MQGFGFRGEVFERVPIRPRCEWSLTVLFLPGPLDDGFVEHLRGGAL